MTTLHAILVWLQHDLKPADLIALFATAIAAWSAKIASQAARAAERAIDSQRLLHVEERRTAYFQSTVITPAILATNSFRLAAVTILGECQRDIGSLNDDAAMTDFKTITRRTTERFNTLYEEFQLSVVVSVRGWGDDALLQAVTRALTETQDKVIAAIGSQISPHMAEPLLPALMEGASEVLALLIRYDRDTDSPHMSSNTDQLRAIQGIFDADRGWELTQRQPRRVGRYDEQR